MTTTPDPTNLLFFFLNSLKLARMEQAPLTPLLAVHGVFFKTRVEPLERLAGMDVKGGGLLSKERVEQKGSRRFEGKRGKRSSIVGGNDWRIRGGYNRLLQRQLLRDLRSDRHPSEDQRRVRQDQQGFRQGNK